jgi:hypothetical protein
MQPFQADKYKSTPHLRNVHVESNSQLKDQTTFFNSSSAKFFQDQSIREQLETIQLHTDIS